MVQYSEILPIAIKAAIEAGIKTLLYYDKSTEIHIKSDNSPLTLADLESNKIINQALVNTDFPIISEENKEVNFELRKHWKTYWLVDPLDGTKEFINKNGEYTINIALIDNRIPVLGVVYIPVLDVLYYSASGLGSFKVENASGNQITDFWKEQVGIRLPIYSNVSKTVVVASRSHKNEDTQRYLNELETLFTNIEIKNFGSSLKFCMIAEGTAHVYPRMAPTMEWDIGAGHSIIIESGGDLLQYPSLKPFTYNKENLLNPSFVAFGDENKGKVLKSR